MAGNASNIRIWETGDVFVFDPDVPFVPATHVPANIDAPLPAQWLAGGLMKGDPGVELPREIDRTDINTWQLGRVLERFKNGKASINFNLLEDNEVSDILVDPAQRPKPVKTYVACEFVDDNGFKERRISKNPVTLWVTNDNKQQDPNGRDVQGSLMPDTAGDIWTIQEGIPV